jgi:hypothetical protein
MDPLSFRREQRIRSDPANLFRSPSPDGRRWKDGVEGAISWKVQDVDEEYTYQAKEDLLIELFMMQEREMPKKMF